MIRFHQSYISQCNCKEGLPFTATELLLIHFVSSLFSVRLGSIYDRVRLYSYTSHCRHGACNIQALVEKLEVFHGWEDKDHFEIVAT